MKRISYPQPLILGAACLLPVLHAELSAIETLRSYSAEIIAKAEPDEWFYSLYDPEVPGSGENVYQKEGIDLNCVECWENGGLPKTNQAYVWGMVRKDNYLWWGTGPNVSRLVSSNYLGADTATISSQGGTTYSVAEYGTSKFAREGVYDGQIQMGPPVPATFGDWRPPSIYRYNLDTDESERLDLELESLDPAAWALLWKTVGLRSAGYTPSTIDFPDGLVILAGPSLTATEGGGDGVIMFAFDAATGDFVKAQSFPSYSNIRKWKYYNGQTYTAIATDSGSGQVLRWRKESATATNPFVFQVVGNLDAGGAELEVHDDGNGARLFVNTWPGVEGNLNLGGDPTAVQNLINAPAGLWRSPVIPVGGLTGTHANSWNLVWSVVDYEPDLVLALHYGGGAMASFDGHLYWGTMHVPGTASFAHRIAYGSPTPPIPRPDPFPEDPEDPARLAYEADVERYEADVEEDFRNSYRAISIWRGKDFTNSGGDIELLYGSAEMPVRLERKQFVGNATNPRDDFNIGWADFFANNLGSLRFVEDGAQVTYRVFLIPTTRTLADGGDWDILPNAGGYTPLYGPESIIPRNYGFGITFPWNNYTWTMQVFGGKLYIGTMDWDDISTPDPTDGADLFCIPSATEPAVRVSGVGMANWSSYGIRTIAADETRGELYLGMANVHNLLNEAVGDPATGGWELQRVKLRYPDDDFDELDDDWESTHFGSKEMTNDPNASSDSDPLTDWEEWLAGTDPKDGNSVFFSVPAASPTPGLQQIEWDSLANRYYTVYETEALDGEWAPVATYVGNGTSMSHEYDPALSEAKFFKVTVSLEPLVD